jgi:hypothetical protein
MKNSLLALFSKETLIKFLAFVFYSITPGAWSKAKDAVSEAETLFSEPGTGAAKFAHAKRKIADAYAELAPRALNWLIETALAFLGAQLLRKIKV